MNDDHSLAASPRAEFADRLEQRLLAEIGRPAAAPRSTDPSESIMTITTERAAARRTPFLVAAAAIAIIAVIGLTAFAAGRHTRPEATPTSSTVPSGVGRVVTFVVRWKHSDVVHECPSDHDKAMCFNRFDMPATATFTGDVDGYGYQAVFWNDRAEAPDGKSDHLEHIAAYNIDASIAGCGNGEFMLMETLQFRSGPNRDLNTATYVGTWQIVAESGRGSLSTISGSGSSSGDVSTAATDGRTFTGRIACP
jgi:hypothetical protein